MYLFLNKKCMRYSLNNNYLRWQDIAIWIIINQGICTIERDVRTIPTHHVRIFVRDRLFQKKLNYWETDENLFYILNWIILSFCVCGVFKKISRKCARWFVQFYIEKRLASSYTKPWRHVWLMVDDDYDNDNNCDNNKLFAIRSVCPLDNLGAACATIYIVSTKLRTYIS